LGLPRSGILSINLLVLGFSVDKLATRARCGILIVVDADDEAEGDAESVTVALRSSAFSLPAPLSALVLGFSDPILSSNAALTGLE
jgi:hypothetical protein